MNNKLYLIPSPLGDNDPAEVLPSKVFDTIAGLRIFVVEELRTARRFLSKAGLRGHIDELEFHTLNEHSSASDARALLELFTRGDVGLISEAGLPAVADPGADLVALCHDNGIDVDPLVGPSSLMMALMGSGLNGQSFAFRGYLPAKTDERRAALKSLERLSARERQSEIFIETPYRNDSLMSDMLSVLDAGTRLCIAADISLPTQTIRTRTVAAWKKEKEFTIGKRPCVFIILG